MLERIWELLTTFTPESQKTIFDKCSEFGFDPNRGSVTLNESYINLNACVSLLKEAIEKKKLIQLPITVQKTIVSNLEVIIQSQTNLIAGTDEVANLNSYIEALNTSVWQYGMFNLSDEVLGYQTKLNQLKQLELEISNLNNELKEGLKLKKKIDDAQISAQQKLDEINVALTNSTENISKINQAVLESTAANQQVSAILASAELSDTSITQSKSNATQSNAEVVAVETKIKEFFNEINTYKNQIIKTATDADLSVANNTTKTNTLVETLDGLENQIKDQLQKATGHSLFHSFQTRQALISKSKDFWLVAISLLLLLTAGLTYYLVQAISGTDNKTSLDIAFFLKLSFSIPLIFAISFCTVQYSRERRLEEEYAFKSNISISLIPYQELVEKLVSKDDKEQRKEYATFIMNTINKVFTSPTEEIFKDKNINKGLIDIKLFKKLGEVAESLSKLKP